MTRPDSGDPNKKPNTIVPKTTNLKSEAQSLIDKLNADWASIENKTKQAEENYWNTNKDTLQKQGWMYKKDTSNDWGGTWSKKKLKEKNTGQNQEVTEQPDPKPQPTPVNEYYSDNRGNRYQYINGELKLINSNDTKGWKNKGLIRNMPEFKEAQKWGNQYVDFGGITWKNPYYIENMFRYTDNAPDWNGSGWGSEAIVKMKDKPGVFPLRVYNDKSYAIDYDNGMAYQLVEDMFGEVDGRGDDVAIKTFNLYDMFNDYYANNPTKRKQGGIMSKIKYFQQGGAAPQQDMQQQIIALVQAAMQGDQKAAQTVNQIMEAAKAGDQQAAQIAQMIQQVAKQMQGQATAAKWGARLNYIKSLKFANGGKTCPACKAGGISNINPTKKDPNTKVYLKKGKPVEEKACGGKAKKRYFGGWL